MTPAIVRWLLQSLNQDIDKAKRALSNIDYGFEEYLYALRRDLDGSEALWDEERFIESLHKMSDDRHFIRGNHRLLCRARRDLLDELTRQNHD